VLRAGGRDLIQRWEIQGTMTAHTDIPFQTLIATARDGIVVIDREGRIRVCNAAAERLFGYSAAEVTGKNIKMLMPSPHGEKDDGYLSRHRTTGEDRIIGSGRELLGLRKDGSTFPLYLSVAEEIFDGQKMYVGTIHELTDRKQWESALIERERELQLITQVGDVLATTLEFEDTLTNIARLVVDNLADLCVINFIDDDGVARRARVFSRDPTKAWVCDALMRMPAGQEQVRIAQSVLETRKPVLIAEVTPDLVRSWAANDEHLMALQGIEPKSAIIAPLLVHGRLLGALSLMSSDASRKYGPEDLQVAAAIAGRAAFFIENARLYRESKRATQARDDMFRVVAHDLRNPLAVIQALATVLIKTGHDVELSQEIMDATNRMARLIQDLVDVTRLQAGSLRLNPERLDAAEIATETEAAQRALVSAASLEIRFEKEPDLPTIWADHFRILQVFENLVGNAIKFTKPGGRITLRAAAVAGEVLFSVADTGRGIPSEQLPHVFDMFWQAPGQEVNRGVGLGLPIVRGIVEAHGGRVWAESSLGQGSTFYFTVPAAPQG
jgi:PAS domain S-box-containing protein